MTSFQVVSPYRPFAPESIEHERLGPFNWVDALRMLRSSVKSSCGVETYAITDVDTDLSVPSFNYLTEQRRLMVWILEVTKCYLASDHFDRDTILISPDTLVFGDLGYWFGPKADLSILVRTQARYQEAGRPILNSVQWFRHASKKKLIPFYERVLAVAGTLPEDSLRWGADSESIRQLLNPNTAGIHHRDGLIVDFINCDWVLESISKYSLAQLDEGICVKPSRPVLDFRYTRKRSMRAYFDAAFGSTVPA